MSELERLKQRLVFQARLDEFLESASLRRLSLAETLGEALPLLRDVTEADQVWVQTLDDELKERVFGCGPAGTQEIPPERVEAAATLVEGREDRAADQAQDGGHLIARTLDVAGESFGTIAAWVQPGSGPGVEEQAELLHVAAEVLDNTLAAVRHARQKQRLVRAIHEALRAPVVHEGVIEAVRQIVDTVRFDLLIVVYHLEEDYQDSLHYLVFRGNTLEFSSRERVANALDEVLRGQHPGATDARFRLVTNAEVEHRRIIGEELVDVADELQSEELLRTLGYTECLETVLIAGIRETNAVGKLVVGSRRPLNTYERDVFDLFADVLQKRIVDFSRTGKVLHRTFPLPVVMRLLDEPDTTEQLTPRSEEISILYADVSSFTRLSEQILRDPVQVGQFIETWAREAVRAIWKRNGVFDKLVGDCVIGLFGPPFYEQSAEERALSCAQAAADIVRYTRDVLPEHPVSAPIVAVGEPLGVAIGINHCPASVGVFGPNKDFTAFSPGMNNTARLQSVATRDEVLVLEPMRALIEKACPTAKFGDRREEKVKNVAAPLAFFALDIDSV